MSEDEAVAPVSREYVKMPKFLPDQPSVFFVMTEAQFVLRNITSDEAKYYHVVSALPPEVVSRIVDLVTAPPTTNKYDAIKQRLRLVRQNVDGTGGETSRGHGSRRP